jgi:hypothetical protein
MGRPIRASAVVIGGSPAEANDSFEHVSDCSSTHSVEAVLERANSADLNGNPKTICAGSGHRTRAWRKWLLQWMIVVPNAQICASFSDRLGKRMPIQLNHPLSRRKLSDHLSNLRRQSQIFRKFQE